MQPVARIQAHLLHDAHRWFDAATPVPPFIWFRRSGAGSQRLSLTMPAVPDDRDITGALATLRAVAAEQGWAVRVEYPDWYAPRLAAMLEAAGMVLADRRALLACRPDTHRGVPEVAGLSITTLTDASSLRDIREGLDVNALGFDPSAPPTTDEAAEAFRRQLYAARAFTARLSGVPVGAGMYTAPHEGVTQLVGITTLMPYRGRGIAAAVTHHITREAFARGVDLAFLTAANEAAGRVYERVGYVPCGSVVTYLDPVTE